MLPVGGAQAWGCVHRVWVPRAERGVRGCRQAPKRASPTGLPGRSLGLFPGGAGSCEGLWAAAGGG